MTAGGFITAWRVLRIGRETRVVYPRVAPRFDKSSGGGVAFTASGWAMTGIVSEVVEFTMSVVCRGRRDGMRMLRRPMCRLIVVFLTVVAMLATGVNIVPEAFGETTDDATSSETVQSPPFPRVHGWHTLHVRFLQFRRRQSGWTGGHRQFEVRDSGEPVQGREPSTTVGKYRQGAGRRHNIRPYRLGLGRERENRRSATTSATTRSRRTSPSRTWDRRRTPRTCTTLAVI